MIFLCVEIVSPNSLPCRLTELSSRNSELCSLKGSIDYLVVSILQRYGFVFFDACTNFSFYLFSTNSTYSPSSITSSNTSKLQSFNWYAQFNYCAACQCRVLKYQELSLKRTASKPAIRMKIMIETATYMVVQLCYILQQLLVGTTAHNKSSIIVENVGKLFKWVGQPDGLGHQLRMINKKVAIQITDHEYLDIILILYRHLDRMNPFAAFDVSDEEDEGFRQVPADKPKKTHQERKQLKQKKIQEAEESNKKVPDSNEPIEPYASKENIKKRNYRPRPHKEIPESGHVLDRRSGTGRVDHPRKQGGGRGNIGNLNDELNKDKYEVEGGEEQTQEEQSQPPQQPEKMTLQEYYRSKGVDLTVFAADKKAPAKKGEVNADWIKKEKLTVMETKEDKKVNERAKGHNKREFKVVAPPAENTEMLGFNAKPKKSQPRQQEPKDREKRGPRDNRKSGKRTDKKPQINEQDFPALA